MNTNIEICGMKIKTQQNTNTVSGIFVLLPGGLISSGLFLLKHFNILYLDFEVILAPFIVITLLAYGDKLIIYLLISPISFTAKLINKVRNLLNNN